VSRYWPLLLVLAAAWGASYLFIKLAVEDIEPAPAMAARTLIAGAVLLAYLVAVSGARPAAADLRASWRSAVVLGVINAAIPFWLIGWGEKHIDSSVAGIAQATVPLFSFVLGLHFLPHERISTARWLGVALGIAGVAVLAGFNPSDGWWAVAGTMAVVVSSVSYALSGIYGQLRVGTVAGPVLATGSMLVAGLILLPFGLAQLPDAVPGWRAIVGVLALALLGTALAQLILYRMLRLYGARRVSLVAYLMPCFAVVYGALLLDEPVSASALLGLALILGGVGLGSGAVRLRRRAIEAAATR
jgi:drug/metabolite transporter (DMT)-like permease